MSRVALLTLVLGAMSFCGASVIFEPHAESAAAARLALYPGVAAQQDVSSGLERAQRSPEDSEYEEVEEDGPEGRHLKKKLKRKFKPHKYGYGGALLNGLIGAYGGYGGYGGPQHGGHHGYPGGYGCRKLHGCGGGGAAGYGGWQQPYGGGPIAGAFAGPAHGYGGWNPGFGYGPRPGPPHGPPHVASWNLGPFQGTFGFARNA